MPPGLTKRLGFLVGLPIRLLPHRIASPGVGVSRRAVLISAAMKALKLGPY